MYFTIIKNSIVLMFLLSFCKCDFNENSFFKQNLFERINSENLSNKQTDPVEKIDYETQDNRIFPSIDLLENVEESTKNVIEWTPEIYPNPFIDFKNCSLKKKGYICDPDDILDEEEIFKLQQSIEGLNENLDNFCLSTNGKQGIDFGIAIMNQFEIEKNKTLRETAYEFAEKLRNKWQLGGRCDNGLLILQSSQFSLLTYSMGKTTQKLIKNVTINALNLNFVDDIPAKSNDQPLEQLQFALSKLSNRLSFINKDKALNKLSTMANNNPKFSNALRNVGATLERHIEEEEKKARLSELSNNEKANIINGELLLIYFLLFILMLTIVCFILGVFLKNRLSKNQSTSQNSSLNKNSTNSCVFSNLADKNNSMKNTLYHKVPTNNNDLTNNLNLDNQS